MKPGGRRAIARGILVSVALAAALRSAEAKVFLTQPRALALVFGDAAKAERKTAYLTDAQADAIRDAAGTPPGGRVVVYYAGAAADGAPVTAWFDTHVVRTLPESIMVVVDGAGKVKRVDILSFDEPEDYLPKPRWLEQFPGRPFDDELSTKKGIRAVTGATLSSRAITDAVRRVLATRAVLAAPPPPPPAPQKEAPPPPKQAPGPKDGPRP